MRAEEPDQQSGSPIARFWRAVPERVFRLLGVAFFGALLLIRLPDYFNDFWSLGPWYQFPDGSRLRLPWTRVLVDLTYVLIVVSYVVRIPPRERSVNPLHIAVAMLGGFWPLLPMLAVGVADRMSPSVGATLDQLLWRESLTLVQVLGCTGLMIAGNLLDVWGYATLLQSFSIVPEARELKITGPYHVVRHPVYLGQVIAQAGIWLVIARLTLFAIVFFGAFCAIQLYRAKLEDRVLAEAFGEQHRAWRSRTFWFGE